HQWGLLDDDVLAWSQSAPPDPGMLRKLMEVRQIFEPKAARWAAERGSDEAREAIRASLMDMEQQTDTAESFVTADAKFHQSILHATENEFLMALEGVIFTALLSSIRLTNTDPRDNIKSVPFHREVYEAIEGRDGAQAETAMETLLADADSRLAERLGSVKNQNGGDFGSGSPGSGEVGETT
ncbi:MAG: FadR/GntR family transcriptional regulator, partial [Hyphomicrobiaceae bacterium]